MDQLNTDLATLQTILTSVVNDVAALPATGAPSTDPNDAVVESMVTALTTAGYTVTPPSEATPVPVTGGTRTASYGLTMSVSVIILALWVLFVGTVWATWITITPHNLGVLSVIVGLVVLAIEIFTHWQPWRRAA